MRGVGGARQVVAVSAPIRPDVRARFRATVARGIARADREQAAELARLRPARRLTGEERRRLHINPRARRPAGAREEDD